MILKSHTSVLFSVLSMWLTFSACSSYQQIIMHRYDRAYSDWIKSGDEVTTTRKFLLALRSECVWFSWYVGLNAKVSELVVSSVEWRSCAICISHTQQLSVGWHALMQWATPLQRLREYAHHGNSMNSMNSMMHERRRAFIWLSSKSKRSPTGTLTIFEAFNKFILHKWCNTIHLIAVKFKISTDESASSGWMGPSVADQTNGLKCQNLEKLLGNDTKRD